VTVAVFGASGQTGRRVVARLREDGHDVLAVGRRASVAGEGIRTAIADLGHSDVDELTGILQGVDAVVFAAAGDPIRIDRDGALHVIEASERAGARRFVLITGMGVGRSRPAEYHGGFWDIYFGAKAASEDGLRSSTLSWTILQPGELLNTPGRGAVELAPTGSLPIGAVSRDDVALTVAAVLADDRTSGRSWEIVQGHRALGDAIERALGAAVDRRA
jgi:uncharacterized protein YbjT (DUF2867 family)